jgi:hypothetical protein
MRRCVGASLTLRDGAGGSDRSPLEKIFATEGALAAKNTPKTHISCG